MSNSIEAVDSRSGEIMQPVEEMLTPTEWMLVQRYRAMSIGMQRYFERVFDAVEAMERSKQ